MRRTISVCWVLMAVVVGGFCLARLGPGEERPPSSPSEPVKEGSMDRIDTPQQSECFRGGLLGLLEGHADQEQPVAIGVQKLLRQLRSSKVPSEEEARKIALGDKFERGGGIQAQESVHVVSLVQIGVDSADFVAAGDLVWIVHIRLMPDLVSQEAWINSRTGDIRWMLPLEGPISEEK